VLWRGPYDPGALAEMLAWPVERVMAAAHRIAALGAARVDADGIWLAGDTQDVNAAIRRGRKGKA
jgi:hypothetical protein